MSKKVTRLDKLLDFLSEPDPESGARVYAGVQEILRERDDIHVMPDDDKHDCSPRCFCEPKLDYQDEVTGKRVWVHKSFEEMNQ